MAKVNFEKLTPGQNQLNDLRELIFLADYGTKGIGELFNLLPGQVNGKRAGFIGSFGLVGKAGNGCDPAYANSILASSEQVWDIKPWEVAESLCFDDLEGTLLQCALRTKTAVGDLTGTEYMDEVVEPKLREAIRQMLNRLAWFGDTAAAAVSGGGVIADAANVPYFSVTDGFWKRIYMAVSADATRRTTVAANAQTTFAAQTSNIQAKGTATGIINSLIMDAPVELRQAADQRIYMTLAMADALNYDLQINNAGSALQWESLFDGVKKAYYQGIEVIVDPAMDKIIKSYEGVSGGKSWNKPFRAVYTTKSNMLVGVSGVDAIEELDIHFDKKDRTNYLYARDAMGTLIADPKLIQVAY